MSLGGFGKKLFEVSRNKIYTFDEYSNEIGLSVEDQEVDGDKPSTYIKGINLEKPSITIQLRQSKNVDVKTELDDWKKICEDKIPYMLFLGEKPVSNNKYLLSQISVSDTTFLNSGKMIKCNLKLSFQEYVRAGVKKEEGTTSSSKKKASKKSNKKSSSSQTVMSEADEKKVSELESCIFGS